MSGMSNFIPAALQIGGTALSVSGNLEAARASALMGQRRQAAANFTADQLEVNAGQEIAAGQAAAQEQERQGKIVSSNILARAAASGGGASDPTVINLIAKNAGMTSYRAALASYQGQASARDLNLKAAAARYGGAIDAADASAASNAYTSKAFSTALTGGASLFSKYWAGPTQTADYGAGGWNPSMVGNTDIGAL